MGREEKCEKVLAMVKKRFLNKQFATNENFNDDLPLYYADMLNT